MLSLVGFNTQPPEGGWAEIMSSDRRLFGFQHTAARRRLGCLSSFRLLLHCFNTQPPEGGWDFAM